MRADDDEGEARERSEKERKKTAELSFQLSRVEAESKALTATSKQCEARILQYQAAIDQYEARVGQYEDAISGFKMREEESLERERLGRRLLQRCMAKTARVKKLVMARRESVLILRRHNWRVYGQTYLPKHCYFLHDNGVNFDCPKTYSKEFHD